METMQALERRDAVLAGGDRPLWRNRPFVSILTGNLVAVFGDCFSGIALSLWVLQTTGSAKRMAFILVSYTLISVLFGSIAGTVADRMSRRKLMLLSDLSRGVVACVLALFMYAFHLPFAAILALICISAFAGLFQGPSFHASITKLAGKGRIEQATSAVYLTDNIARISGLALAGVAVATFGGVWAMVFNAATFFFSALCVILAGPFQSTPDEPATSAGPFQSAEEAPGSAKEKKSLWTELKLGLAYIRKDPLTRSIVILNPLIILLFMSSLMLIQVVAIKEWKAGPIAFGLIEMCVPLGYLIGAGIIMALGSKLGRKGWWVFTGVVTLGPVYVIIAMLSNAVSALPLILLGGMLFAFCSMMMQIILRSEVPNDMQGRVYGTLGSITGVAPSIGLLLSSALADVFGAHVVLGAQGLCLLLVGIAAIIWLKPIRRY
ncbi:major facilitator superfamily MFS_1 [Paenibacillus curdlanolyticus YK9]|uniref:Major facilitator superfamily MFS_1 n=1 Tax=Paenibacillus curdlanolyticus YK9 TaxID=717606 RepID=E0I7R2_9BACL|nr:MFS transporter [Paenibacillus curdlanolyticus]EFM11217.1 major facilitator superfamily MFS_1 [Paenibacillus curdlanolyticus YK9]